MPSSHLILCRPLLLLPPILPSIRVFSNESTLCKRWPKYWSFSLSLSPSSEHPGLISFRMDWLDLLAVQGTLKSLLQYHSSKASILRHSAFFTVQLSYPYTTTGKTIALTRWTYGFLMITSYLLWLFYLFTLFSQYFSFGQSWFLKNVPFSDLFQNRTHWGLYEQTFSSGNPISHAENVGEVGCISCKPFFHVNKWKRQVKNLPVAQTGKESASNAGDPVSIPGLGRSPGEENGYPLQYSCLENSMNRRAWWVQSIGLQRVGKKTEGLTYISSSSEALNKELGKW